MLSVILTQILLLNEYLPKKNLSRASSEMEVPT
jgi:hypothetical protein